MRKRWLQGCFALSMLLLAGCGSLPASKDVVGVWTHADGAELIIKANGQFTARSLPNEIFWRRDQPGKLNGSGTWRLVKKTPYWEVKLGFDEIDGQPASRELGVLASGSGDSIILYQWVEEEGDERFEMRRQ